MIKLYGVTISNYYNTAKLALVEKGLAFEEVSMMPSQEPDILAASPMGKVPYIECEGRTLSETNVIFDYLEDIQPQPALYPADPWARAKAKEIIRTVELYLDLPARRHLGTIYFGSPVDPIAFDEVRPALEKGLRALEQLSSFEPYIAGEAFTFADIAAYFQLRFTNLHTMKVYDWDVTGAMPGLRAYLDLIAERPSVDVVDSVAQKALDAFLPQ